MMIKRVRARLFTGLLIILPLVASLWVLNLLFGIIDGLVTQNVLRLLEVGPPLAWWMLWSLRLTSVAVVLAVLYLIGLLGTNVFGRRLLHAGDRAAERVPVIGGVYRATRQVIDALGRGRVAPFRRCVLVPFPRKGLWTLAFVTNEDVGALGEPPQPVHAVFLPTTPNPTSGYMLFVPAEDCIPLQMTIEEGVKMVVSGGIVARPGWYSAVPAQADG